MFTLYLPDSPYKLQLDNAIIKMSVDGTIQMLSDRWTQGKNEDCQEKVHYKQDLFRVF